MAWVRGKSTRVPGETYQKLGSRRGVSCAVRRSESALSGADP